MKPAEKILQKVRRGVKTVAYGNPIYQKMLSASDAPQRLHFTPPDSWPGNSQDGTALMSGQRSLFGQPSPPRHATAFRNLRAVGTDAARVAAAKLIVQWLETRDQWNDVEWAPDILGERIAGWIGFYEFYAPVSDAEVIAALTASLQRQYKHLLRTMPSSLGGVSGLRTIKGLIYGGLNFEDGDKALILAADLLKRQLMAEILPDGSHISRCPSSQLHVLRHLIDLRTAFKAAGIEVPEIVRTSIALMVPALKFYRHGDNGLALFHGGNEETSLLIDAVITQAEARGRMPRRLTNATYERLIAGRSLLIADGGGPPERNPDKTGHAGLLSFEFGHGRERLIVNCGAAEDSIPAWRTACAATAAHSTITVGDTNACEILESGGVTSSAHIETQCYEENGTQCLDMSHDGYQPLFGLIHRRFLSLDATGEDLQGKDQLLGRSGQRFALRWHLHPSVQTSLAQSGQTALLRTPSGLGWRLRVENFALQLEPSIYCGSGAPRRSLHLKIAGTTGRDETNLVWSLTREKKA